MLKPFKVSNDMMRINRVYRADALREFTTETT